MKITIKSTKGSNYDLFTKNGGWYIQLKGYDEAFKVSYINDMHQTSRQTIKPGDKMTILHPSKDGKGSKVHETMVSEVKVVEKRKGLEVILG